MADELTPKQRRFVEEYCVDFNKTQAAIRAGYSERSAHDIGYENMKKPHVAAAVEARLDDLSMSAAEATKRLSDWGRGDVSPFLVADESGRVGIDLSTEEAQANIGLIKKLKQRQRMIASDDEDGPAIIERKTEIELHDAKDAVKQIAKIRGLFKEQVEVSGRVVMVRDVDELEASGG